MINKLLEKYLDEKKKEPAKAPKGYEWVDGQWKPKKKLDESSGCGSGLAIGDTFWNRRPNLIYVRNEEVLFSSTGEFPTGSPMTDEIRKNAKSRGFILLDW